MAQSHAGSILSTEEAEMHIILVAAAPPGATAETVLFKDLLHLTAHRDAVRVILGVPTLACDDFTTGGHVGIGLIIDIDGRTGVMLGLTAGGPVSDDGVDGILRLTLIYLLEA